MGNKREGKEKKTMSGGEGKSEKKGNENGALSALQCCANTIN